MAQKAPKGIGQIPVLRIQLQWEPIPRFRGSTGHGAVEVPAWRVMGAAECGAPHLLRASTAPCPFVFPAIRPRVCLPSLRSVMGAGPSTMPRPRACLRARTWLAESRA